VIIELLDKEKIYIYNILKYYKCNTHDIYFFGLKNNFYKIVLILKVYILYLWNFYNLFKNTFIGWLRSKHK